MTPRDLNTFDKQRELLSVVERSHCAAEESASGVLSLERKDEDHTAELFSARGHMTWP